MKRILVGANLTRRRDVAFNRGLALARTSGAELHVLHAVPAHHPFSVGAKERLERRTELQRRAGEAGVTARIVEQHGDPTAIIELHANAYAVDLIVLGTGRKTTWLRRPSVTERVLHRTTRPTLIVPTNDAAIAAFGHVLVALDLTPETNGLVDRAIQLAGSGSRRVTVVHAVKGIEAADAVQTPARWRVPEYRTHVLEDARRQLESVLTSTPSSVDASVQLATGTAATAIVEQAKVLDADLVVVGKSRRFRPLGSTALRVLRDNGRALLVIPVADTLGTSDGAKTLRRAA